MHQNLIDTLLAQYEEKGYVTEDSVFDALILYKLPLDEVDVVCETLLLKGIIIQNEFFEPDEDVFYDRSHTDYERIFQEVITVDEKLEPLINDIRQIKPPQHREWQNLIIQAKGGNSFARKRIIEMYLRVVIRIALWHYHKYGISLSEAVQDGCLGLAMAYEKFELDKQDNFSTYAPWWIRQYIMREAQPANSLMYYPAHYKEKLFAAYELNSVHSCGQCGVYLVCPELVKGIVTQFGCSANEAKTLLRYLIPIDSLEQLLEADELIFSDEGAEEENLINYIETQERNDMIFKVLSMLKIKERNILELRFGLLDGVCLTLEEVGLKYNVTRERIRQIETRAIEKLRHPSKSSYIKPFY